MAESIKSFVDHLHEQGIEAGRREAERIKSDAQAHAEIIIRIAEERAARIVERAEEQSRKARHQLEIEMRLAARDALLLLQSALTDAVRRVLDEKTEAVLQNPAHLEGLIREVVAAYAGSEAGNDSSIRFNLAPEALKALESGALNELKAEGNPSLIFQNALEDAGFEYTVRGAVHEITRESVVDVLAKMVSPTVKALIEAHAEAGAIADPSEDARTELSSAG